MRDLELIANELAQSRHDQAYCVEGLILRIRELRTEEKRDLILDALGKYWNLLRKREDFLCIELQKALKERGNS